MSRGTRDSLARGSRAEVSPCRAACRVRHAAAAERSSAYDFAPPRPYAWKTDEFSTKSEARKTVGGTSRIDQHGQTTPIGNYQQQQLAHQHAQQLSQPYRCSNCMSQFLPRLERRISTAGWITFAVLLVFVFPLFWIGLLIREDVRVCPSCNSKVG